MSTRNPHVMFCDEIARRLGYTLDYLRRHIDRLVAEKNMPAELPGLGRRRWDRAAIEAWLRGQHAPRAANDDAQRIDEHDAIAQQRAALHDAYGRAG